MAIDTLKSYVPKLALPLFTRIIPPEHNDYRVGNKYDMRIEDRERQQETGGRGNYYYVNECLLVGKEETTFGELDDLLMAFDAHTKSRGEAERFISPGDKIMDDEREVVVLFFLRTDKAMEWIQSEAETIEPPTSVEEFESN